ncbi:Yip1 domain-containing protein [Streptomyces sp. TverLS-915]|uniref:Yip1 family protein n=1 Tax=Streptomyces sp. TverLS-915 TaxID=1839763 RepID=UPI00081F10DC|nr:Yip1 family protein [Streptomyces sp. TverLS-915]SCD75283.1 Yip1 domain-containing protein [Streptomyces sp. TverLS-915]
MAGFRIGRGRDNRTSGQQQNPGGRPPQGQYPAPGQRRQQQPYGGAPRPPQSGGNGWPAAPQGNGWPAPQGRPSGPGEPEYFGGPPQGHPGPRNGGHGYPDNRPPQQQGGGYGYPGPSAQAPYPSSAQHNNPGHTQAFAIGEDPYGHDAPPAPAAPSGPRLRWQDLLSGIVLRPNQTFQRMRDYPVWGPALVVTFVYGLLAIFGFDEARDDVIHATLGTAVPYVLTAAVMITVSAFVLGVVTHTLARQLGGDGSWQPTVGLSMLIMTLTDAPRLIIAMFAGGDASFVQVVGWVTWIAAGLLFTSMVSRSHDLAWPRALGASAIQLAALLSLIKLGTF